MKLTKKNQNVMLLIVAILCYIATAINIFVCVMLAFDLWGVAGLYGEILTNYLGLTSDAISSQISWACFEYILIGLVNLYFGNFYIQAYRYRFSSVQFGKKIIFMAIIQMLLASFMPALIALIAGIIMTKKKRVAQKSAVENGFLSEYKMEAMTEAVERLKKLKEIGAISEEEYYANLNKILEG